MYFFFLRIKIHSTEGRGKKARPACKQGNKIKARQHSQQGMLQPANTRGKKKIAENNRWLQQKENPNQTEQNQN